MTSIPKTKTSKKKILPWWTKELSDLIKKRKNYFRKFIETYNLRYYELFLSARFQVRKLMRYLKKLSWENYVSTINSRTPSSEVFNKLLLMNNNLITDPVEICEAISLSFEHISSSNNYNSLFLQNKHLAEAIPLFIPDGNNEVYNFPLSSTELKIALSECRGSSPGPDNIHYDMMKILSNDGMSILLYIYNKIWTNKIFPAIWRNALLIPILKPGKDRNLPSSYRPISLTNCLCKVLERIVNKRLTWFFENRYNT